MCWKDDWRSIPDFYFSKAFINFNLVTKGNLRWAIHWTRYRTTQKTTTGKPDSVRRQGIRHSAFITQDNPLYVTSRNPNEIVLCANHRLPSFVRFRFDLCSGKSTTIVLARFAHVSFSIFPGGQPHVSLTYVALQCQCATAIHYPRLEQKRV